MKIYKFCQVRKFSSCYKLYFVQGINQVRNNTLNSRNKSLNNPLYFHKFKYIPYCYNYYSNNTLLNYEKLIPKINDHEEWKIFYRFSYIVPARILNRLKLYQTCFTLVILPCVTTMYFQNLVSFASVQCFYCISLFACIMLYVMGSCFGRLIGSMYLHKDDDVLKVSHLNFWGKRRDFLLPVSSVIPLIETSSKGNDIFVKLMKYDSKMVMYFSLKYGEIIDEEMFAHVFGSVEHL